MDYRKLRYFRVVAEKRSFHQAADMLRVSQPALTRAIKELEIELGVRLFARHSRGVDLTREGTVLLSHATKLIRDLDVARNAVVALGVQPRGLVSIGVPPALSVLLLANVAETVSANWPEIVLNFHERLMPDLLGMMEADQLDIAVVGNPRRSPAVNLIPLVDEDVILAAHKRFDTPERLSLGDLRNYPLVMSGSGIDTFSWFEEAVHDRSILQSTRFRVESPALAIALVKSGLGCAVLPTSTMPYIEAHPELRSSVIEDIRLKRYLATGEMRARSPAVDIVLDVLREEFAALVRQGIFEGDRKMASGR